VIEYGGRLINYCATLDMDKKLYMK
jgi:hypothetical protein